MLYRYLRSKDGFSLMEILTVMIVLAILTAIAIPVFMSGYRNNAIKDCNNQRVIISSLFGEAMTGMFDNGKTQTRVDFEKVPDTHMTTYPGDGVNGTKDDDYKDQECFVLIEDQGIPGKVAFTIGDIRGGYFGQDQWNSYSEVVRVYGAYNEYFTEKYDIGVERGYYLKKQALENEKFYLHFINQEIPVCPFADFDNNDTSDDYRYYIFEDGTVVCSCPHCNE